jgi:hypothetical protein
VDTTPLRASFSLHHEKPTVHLTDCVSVPFWMEYRTILGVYSWWVLRSNHIGHRGRMTPRTVARSKCPDLLRQEAERLFDEHLEEMRARNEKQFEY